MNAPWTKKELECLPLFKNKRITRHICEKYFAFRSCREVEAKLIEVGLVIPGVPWKKIQYAQYTTYPHQDKKKEKIPCITCKVVFSSWDKRGNRMCDNCRRNANASPYEPL